MRPLGCLLVACVMACSDSGGPNPVAILAFDYNENKQPQAGDVPYDSVRIAATQLQVERRYAATLCTSTLESIVTSTSGNVNLRVSQNPVASCGAAPGLITWRATMQVPAGTWRLQVTEVNGTTPTGAVVLDRSVTVPGR